MKGIGTETLNDLKGIYDTVESLIYDLKVKEVVYVRNDIVNILERELKEWL